MRELLRRAARDVLLGARPAQGWAGESLDRSLNRAVVLGALLWQPVMIWAVLGSDLRLPAWQLILASVAVAGCAVGVLRGRLHPGVLAAATYAGLMFAWYGAESIAGALCFAGAWQHNILAVAIPLTSRHVSTFWWPALMAVVTPVFLLTVHDDWQALASSSIVTTLAIVVGTKLAVPRLRGFADAADAASVEAARDREALSVTLAASSEAAEDARTLHDTVINTFAAVAAGGAATEDEDLVRERCRRDVPAVEALLRGRAPADDAGLRAAAEAQPVAVTWTGATAAEAEVLENTLPTAVRRALVGAVRELVQNVVKHAGVAEVTIDVRADDGALTVVVADDGVGFDGVAPAGRGLAESVQARAHEAGIGVAVESVPGTGTTVTLTARQRDQPGGAEVPSESGFGTVLEALRDRGCWAWCATVIGVGFTIAPLNTRGDGRATLAMLGLLIALTVVSWRLTRGARVLPIPASAAVVVAVPVVFLLSFAGVGYGHDDIIRWQAIAVTALPVILLVHGRSRAEAAAGVAAHVLTVLVLVVVLLPDEPEIAAVVAVAGVPAIAVVAAWWTFLRAIEAIAARAVQDQERAFASRLEGALVTAVADARTRWTTAGLRSSLRLLQDLASGAVSAHDPQVRSSCGREEAHLRQLTLISPRAVHLGPWLARSLAAGRERGVELVMRTGDLDVADRGEADALGELVVAAVAAVTAVPTRAALTVGLFADGDAPQLTLLGAHPVVGDVLDAAPLPSTWVGERSTFEGTDLVVVRKDRSAG